MTTDLEIAANNKSPKRPWHRLHCSTWLMILIALAVLVILEAPGEIKGISEDITANDLEKAEVFNHGWPWCYLTRTRAVVSGVASGSVGSQACGDDFNYYEGKEDVGNAPWLVLRAWSFAGSKNFSPLNLFLDLMIAVSFVCAVAFFFEWRIRHNLRLWQFTLRELCGLCVVVAVIMSWWAVHHRLAVFENDILENEHRWGVFSTEYSGPMILAKLFGESNLSDFEHIRSFKYSVHGLLLENLNTELRSLLPELSRLPYLTSVKMDCYGDFQEEDFTRFAKLGHITDLSLNVEKNTDSWLGVIQHMKGLKSLNIENYDEPARGYQGLSELTSLSKLGLKNLVLDDGKLAFLSSFKQLRSLQLECFFITDESVETLGGLKGLEELDIVGTRITSAGQEKLKTLLPNCKITAWEPLNDDSKSKN
jgi:hypothetical protein